MPATTVLSPYLKFGCVSIRSFYWELDKVRISVACYKCDMQFQYACFPVVDSVLVVVCSLAMTCLLIRVMTSLFPVHDSLYPCLCGFVLSTSFLSFSCTRRLSRVRRRPNHQSVCLDRFIGESSSTPSATALVETSRKWRLVLSADRSTG